MSATKYDFWQGGKVGGCYPISDFFLTRGGVNQFQIFSWQSRKGGWHSMRTAPLISEEYTAPAFVCNKIQYKTQGFPSVRRPPFVKPPWILKRVELESSGPILYPQMAKLREINISDFWTFCKFPVLIDFFKYFFYGFLDSSEILKY